MGVSHFLSAPINDAARVLSDYGWGAIDIRKLAQGRDYDQVHCVAVVRRLSWDLTLACSMTIISIHIPEPGAHYVC